MPLNRPNLETVKAKLREIANRYRRKRRHATKPQLAAIRIAELNRLFSARYGERLPDNEIGREAILIVAHHMICLAGHPQQRMTQWAELRAPWLTVTELHAVLAEIATRPQTWKADSLAWRLKLTYADRQALKITTIGAIDCSAKRRQTLRRNKQKQRMKKLRKAKRLAACAP